MNMKKSQRKKMTQIVVVRKILEIEKSECFSEIF